jgi:hypothetical protein
MRDRIPRFFKEKSGIGRCSPAAAGIERRIAVCITFQDRLKSLLHTPAFCAEEEDDLVIGDGERRRTGEF